MHLHTTVSSTLGFAAAVALLAGCSARSSPIATPGGAGGASALLAVRTASTMLYGPGLQKQHTFAGTRATRKSWMQHVDTRRPLTYVADFLGNSVTVLDRGANLIGFIGGLTNPNGLFVDPHRNLWVANEYGNNVLEFARGSTSPRATLTDPSEFPVDVAVCPNGTIYASNLFEGGPSGTGSLSVYAGGSTKPTGSLTYPGQNWNYFVACDAAGNVFTDLFTSDGAAAVVEYPGGSQSGATILSIPLLFPGGIKLNNAGNLLVNDQQARTVTEYTEAGTPTGVSITYGDSTNDWVDIAVTRNGSVVGGADAMLIQGTSVAFPSDGQRQIYHVPTGPSGNLPYGIAFDPGQHDL